MRTSRHAVMASVRSVVCCAVLFLGIEGYAGDFAVVKGGEPLAASCSVRNGGFTGGAERDIVRFSWKECPCRIIRSRC